MIPTQKMDMYKNSSVSLAAFSTLSADIAYTRKALKMQFKEM